MHDVRCDCHFVIVCFMFWEVIFEAAAYEVRTHMYGRRTYVSLLSIHDQPSIFHIISFIKQVYLDTHYECLSDWGGGARQGQQE